MDLLLIVIASIVMLPLAAFTEGLARIIIGVFLVLFIPGYALVAALFPRRTALDSLTRLALSVGISLAVVPIILLVLNFTAWHIRLHSVLFSFILFTGSMAGIAWFRRRRLLAGERFAPALGATLLRFFRSWVNQAPMNRALNALLVLAVFGVVGTVGYVVANPAVNESFTEFYLLGLQGKAQDYPLTLTLGEEGQVLAGIVNHENLSMAYSIEIMIGGEKVNEIGPIKLAEGEKWEQLVSFAPTKSGRNQSVEFLLRKEGAASGQYLHLWIDVQGKT